jgi:hypothetical protein
MPEAPIKFPTPPKPGIGPQPTEIDSFGFGESRPLGETPEPPDPEPPDPKKAADK